MKAPISTMLVPTSFTALVLAGQDPHDPLRHRTPLKAHLPYQGKSLMYHVLHALQGCPFIQSSIVVGTPHPDTKGLITAHTPGGEHFIESVRNGLNAVATHQPHTPLLIITADLPFLRASSLTHFLQAAHQQAPHAALIYPIVPRHSMEQAFPGQQRTYVHLQDGVFTGGNLITVQPQLLPTLLPFMDRAYKGRKNPLALAHMFGLGTVFKVLVRLGKISELEQRASHLLNSVVRAVITDEASLAADIDKPTHLPYLDS